MERSAPYLCRTGIIDSFFAKLLEKYTYTRFRAARKVREIVLHNSRHEPGPDLCTLQPGTQLATSKEQSGVQYDQSSALQQETVGTCVEICLLRRLFIFLA